MNDKTINSAIESVTDLEKYLVHTGIDIDSVPVPSIKQYFASLIAEGENTIQRLADLARYFYMTDQKELSISICRVKTPSGVLNLQKKIPDEAGPLEEVSPFQITS